MSRLGVITINRNNAAGLRRTLESVAAQTVPPAELVLVDGASTDDSMRVFAEFAGRNPGWRARSERDRGISDALNKGVDLAQADWLIFLNSGDTFDGPEVVRALEPFTSRPPERSILVGSYRIDSGAQSVVRTPVPARLAVHNALCHQAMVIPRAALSATRFDLRLSASMDYDVWLRLSQEYQYQVVDCVIARFERGGVSNAPGQIVANAANRFAVRWLNQRKCGLGTLLLRGGREVAGDLFREGLRAAGLQQWIRRARGWKGGGP